MLTISVIICLSEQINHKKSQNFQIIMLVEKTPRTSSWHSAAIIIAFTSHSPAAKIGKTVVL